MGDKNEIDFNKQFDLGIEDYLKGIDLANWLRYYSILKEVISFSPKDVLEIGAGNEVVKNCLKNHVKSYEVMDINYKLHPTILNDVRNFQPGLKEKFDCVICADVLEHMPFEDFEKNMTNIRSYLEQGGKAFITIPHRRARFLLVTPFSAHKTLVIELPAWIKSSLRSFYKQVIKGKIFIDPHHCWEIGDGRVRKEDVEEAMKKSGFNIEKFEKILYVDFWILKKK
jgi:cyclopropane fatty-acyl-phospholipid synthase-like methyltransferase